MNKKLILATAFAVAFSASAHNASEGLVDSQGNTVHNSDGVCVEVMDGTGDCGVAKPVAPETVTLGAHALFDTAKYNIKSAGRAELKTLATAIKSLKSIAQISVVGHADSRGNDRYNQRLSENRANAVRAYLVKQGVSADMISASGMGESSPIATNKTKAGRKANRRVEITVSGAKDGMLKKAIKKVKDAIMK